MAGSATPALAVAVSNAGGMGSFGCAALSHQQLREQTEATRAATNRPFNLNFFVHRAPTVPLDGAAKMLERLDPFYDELELWQVPALSSSMPPFDEATIELVLELRPRVVSFHFGLPEQAMVDALKSTGAVILSSATTVTEARALEAAGADAVIAQGYEAGGHRGTFKGGLQRRVDISSQTPYIQSVGRESRNDEKSTRKSLSRGTHRR